MYIKHKPEPEVIDAILAVRERKREIRNRLRREGRQEKYDYNYFGSELDELDFHEKYMTFDEKWS